MADNEYLNNDDKQQMQQMQRSQEGGEVNHKLKYWSFK